MAVGSLSAGHIIDTIGNWPDGEIGPCLDWIKGEMFP